MQITKDTVIGELLEIDRELARFLFEIGMHCVGCPSAQAETVEQACAVHGVNPDELIKKMNDYLASKK
jgi:hybrid cluster-associated redox disulfide protein